LQQIQRRIACQHAGFDCRSHVYLQGGGHAPDVQLSHLARQGGMGHRRLWSHDEKPLREIGGLERRVPVFLCHVASGLLQLWEQKFLGNNF